MLVIGFLESPHRLIDMSVSRRTTFVSTLFLTSVAVLAALLLQRGFPILESEQTLGSNLSFLALINVNIVAVMILAFVVVRNVIRLVLDRKRNILGARLRTRLVFAFVFLSMVPTVLLFLVAQGMVGGVLEDWFSPKIELALDSSRNLANDFYSFLEKNTIESHRDVQENFKNKFSHKLENGGRLEKSEVQEFLNSFVKTSDATEYYLITDNGEVIASSIGGRVNSQEPTVDLSLSNAFLSVKHSGDIYFALENTPNTEYLKLYSSLTSFSHPAYSNLYLVTLRFISPNVSKSVKGLLTASEEYSAFKSYQRPLASSYFLTLVVVTLLIIFAAISIAFFLSRSLAVPIGLLAKGTEQIANGNLNYSIPEVGDDELGVLVKGFNQMTTDLRIATAELVNRSRYIETVLSSLEVGVLSIDNDGFIRTLNEAGIKILGIADGDIIIGNKYTSVLPPEFVRSIDEINQRNLRGKNQVVSKNISYSGAGSLRHLSITLSKLIEENTRLDVGLVVLVDDVTDLERAQRMAAWQEVARRIAHEIKNPLTPIQLSAERISRIQQRSETSGAISDSDNKRVVTEATEVIINQVQNLRQLVNEFSNFARMPKSELKLGKLNDVVIASIDAVKNSNPEILFNVELQDDIPEMLIDAHQFERVLINLLDNSISALRDCKESQPKLQVKTRWDSHIKIVSLEVSDNGPGVSDKDKQRIFDPYYSKKSDGTGLGLAIVKTVVSDHNGFIRALNNPEGKGLTIRIEIPLLL